MPYACLALSINFRRSLNRKKGRAYTLHKPVRSLFIQIVWSNAEIENQSNRLTEFFIFHITLANILKRILKQKFKTIGKFIKE